jgi:CTP synthase
VIELERGVHPFYVASQFHPEFKSRPERPAPLFREFVGEALARAQAAPQPIHRFRSGDGHALTSAESGAKSRATPAEADVTRAAAP